MRRLAAALLVWALAAPAGAAFFRVAQREGRWWLIDPAGQPFLCRSPNVIELGPEPAKWDKANPSYCALKSYKSEGDWAQATWARLTSWGFNAVGGYSDHEPFRKLGAPFCIALTCGGMYGAPWVDPRDPGSLKAFEDVAKSAAKFRDDPLLIGYFIDNELGWYDETVFTFWMQQGPASRIKRKLYKMLEARYGGDVRALQRDILMEPAPKTFADVARELKSVTWAPGRRPAVIEPFIEWLAGEYYESIATAIRKRDPRHLLLGDRYASWYSQPVARAAGRYMDVVSANYNAFAQSGWVSPAFFDTLARLTKRPLMITEYYCAAAENESGDQNRNGPFLTVRTQKERAAGARRMTETFARLPSVVGWHWFAFSDEPPQGRGDGEDFNFGLVDVKDRPYKDLTAALAEVQTAAMDLHRKGPAPDGLVQAGDEWWLPRAAGPITVDGRLDDWRLPAAWAPRPVARPPFLPSGDFYLTWKPEGLLVALAYRDFGIGADEDPDSRTRLTVIVRRAGQKPAVFELVGLHEKIGPEPAEVGGKKPEDTRPWKPLTVAAGKGKLPSGFETVGGSQSANSLEALGEVLIPVAALGGTPLASGEVLRVAACIQGRANVKELGWPDVPAGRDPLAMKSAAVRLVEVAAP